MECGETALALDDALFFPAWRPDDQGLETSSLMLPSHPTYPGRGQQAAGADARKTRLNRKAFGGRGLIPAALDKRYRVW